MKRSQLALAVAGLVASSASYAVIDHYGAALGSGPGQPSAYGKAASLWAKELAASQTSVLVLRALYADWVGNKDVYPLDITVPVGFAVPANQSYYFRIDLDNGAQFNADPACNTIAPAAYTCNKSLGGKNSSFVTYELKATSGQIAPTAGIYIGVGSGNPAVTNSGIIVSDTSKDISFKYTLHNSKDSAETTGYRDTGIMSTIEGPYIQFVDGVKVNYTAGSNLVSDVAADFLTFASSAETGVALGERGQLGTFTYGVNTGDTLSTGASTGIRSVFINDTSATNPGLSIPLKTASNYPVEQLSMIANDTSTTLEISGGTAGGFSFLQDASGTVASGTYASATSKIYLGFGASTNCTSAPAANTSINATKVTADTATFTINTATIPPSTTKTTRDTVYAVCFAANKAVPIADNDYTAKLVPGATTTSKPNAVSGKLRNIAQNGTVLDTPFITLFPDYISRTVFSNSGSNPVKYTATVITDDGATATLGAKGTGTIPAGKLFEVNTSDLVALSGKPRGAVRFTISGSNQTLGGVFQVVKIAPTIGDVQNLPLIRKGGNYDPTTK
jgi:hypothetical protein